MGKKNTTMSKKEAKKLAEIIQKSTARMSGPKLIKK